MNHCGACRACCRALGVLELAKPEWQMCKHVCKEGCGIYDARPESCQKYSCAWLITQRGKSPMPARLRPDRCGVIFDTLDAMPEKHVAARVAPGNEAALGDPYVRAVIGQLVDDGFTVLVRIGDKTSAPVRATKLNSKPTNPVVIRGLT